MVHWVKGLSPTYRSACAPNSALLFGLPLLAVVSQLVAEWRAEYGRRILQQLAVRTGVEQSGKCSLTSACASSKADTLAMPAGRKASALDDRHLVGHVSAPQAG